MRSKRRTMAEIAADPHWVYRFWKDERLLYVGCTHDFGRRMQDHFTAKSWFQEVNKITLAWYPDKSLASAAEQEAIREEKPEFNQLWYGKVGHFNRPYRT
jgi:predicted GIY-YIG superfamily endonuclease